MRLAHSSPACRSGRRRGATIVEISIALAIAAVVFTALARTLGGAANAVEHARQASRATAFLRTTAENLATQEFAALATLDGAVLVDGETEAESEVEVTLEVTPVEVDLVEVVAVARSRATGRVLGRTSLRRAGR